MKPLLKLGDVFEHCSKQYKIEEITGNQYLMSYVNRNFKPFKNKIEYIDDHIKHGFYKVIKQTIMDLRKGDVIIFNATGGCYSTHNQAAKRFKLKNWKRGHIIMKGVEYKVIDCTSTTHIHVVEHNGQQYLYDLTKKNYYQVVKPKQIWI